MTSKEIVRRVVRRQDPPRLGWDFLDKRYCDIQYASPVRLVNEATSRYQEFGDYEELKRRANFHGEVRMDAYGNIYGSLNGRTKGECVLGALEGDWEALADYHFPEPDPKRIEEVKAMNLSACEKYVIGGLPMAVFSTLRDLRKMDNALMDTVAEPEMIKYFGPRPDMPADAK